MPASFVKGLTEAQNELVEKLIGETFATLLLHNPTARPRGSQTHCVLRTLMAAMIFNRDFLRKVIGFPKTSPIFNAEYDCLTQLVIAPKGPHDPTFKQLPAGLVPRGIPPHLAMEYRLLERADRNRDMIKALHEDLRTCISAAVRVHTGM